MAADRPEKLSITPREATRDAESDSMLERYFEALGNQKIAIDEYLALGVGTYDKLPPNNVPANVIAAHKKVEDAEAMANKWKKEWKKQFPFKNFQKEADSYATLKVGGVAPSPVTSPTGSLSGSPVDPETQTKLDAYKETKDKVVKDTKTLTEELRKDLDGLLKERGISNILSALNEAGLNIADLNSSASKDGSVDSRQRRAIRIVLPDHAEIILNSLTSEVEAARKEAQAILLSIHDKLEAAFKISEETQREYSKFSEEIPTEFVKSKIGKLAGALKEKPVETVVASIAVIGAIYYLWKNDYIPDFMKKGLQLLGGVGIAGYGLNYLSGMLSEDGKTLVQRVWGDPISWKPDSPAMTSFRDAIEGRYADSNAFEAMMHMQGAKVGTITAALERALYEGDPDKRMIRTRTFVSRNQISGSEAGYVDPHGLYKGFATLAIDAARNKGVDSSIGEEALLREGIKILKNDYNANTTLPYVVGGVYLGIDQGKEVSDKDGSLLGANVGGRSVEEKKEERTLETLLGSTTNPVEVLLIQGTLVVPEAKEGQETKESTATYLINGYPFELKKTVTSTQTITYTISDPAGRLPDAPLPTAALTQADAQAVREYAQKAAEADFKENFDDGKGTYQLVYVPSKPGDKFGSGYFDIKGVPAALELAGLSSDPVAVELKATYNKDGVMVLMAKGSDETYESIEKAVEARKIALINEKMTSELGFLLGTLAYKVDLDKVTASGTETTVFVTYDGTREGSFVFEKGKLKAIQKLENGPELEHVWIEAAKSDINDLFRYRDLEKSFEELERKITADQSVLNNESWTSWIKGYTNAADYFGLWDTSAEFAHRSAEKVKDQLKIQYADQVLGDLKSSAASGSLPLTERDWDQKMLGKPMTDISAHLKTLGITVPQGDTWASWLGARADKVEVVDAKNPDQQFDPNTERGRQILRVESEAARKEIQDLFTQIGRESWEGLATSWTGFSNSEAFVQDKVDKYQTRMTSFVSSLESRSTFTLKELKDGIEAIKKDARKEYTAYDTLVRRDHGKLWADPEVTEDTLLKLSQDRLPDAKSEWVASNEFFFDYLAMKFHLGTETAYGMIRIEDPLVLRDMHEYYAKMIEGGKNYYPPVAPNDWKTPNQYTHYVVDQVNRLVQRDYTGIPSIDMDTWKKIRLSLEAGSGDKVMTYTEWFNDAGVQAINPPELDRTRTALDNFEAIKESASVYVVEKLSEMVPDNFFGLAGWKASFARHGLERYQKLVLDPLTTYDKGTLQSETDRFLKLMKVEGRLYSYAYEEGVKPNSRQNYYPLMGICSALGVAAGAYMGPGRFLWKAILGGGLGSVADNALVDIWGPNSLGLNFLPSFGVSHGTKVIDAMKTITDAPGTGFEAIFKSKGAPTLYANNISAGLQKVIDEQAKIDESQVNLGPLTFRWFNGVDPVQTFVIPGLD